MRGDEPGIVYEDVDVSEVFPTCVGMNRPNTFSICACVSFPHMRGDEPSTGIVASNDKLFSPHAWG